MKTLLASFVLWWLLAAAPVPASADDQFKVLVVAVPNRYHHDYTVVAKPRLEQMARQHGFGLDWAWNTAPFDADLSGFDAIVLLNTPGDELRGAQRAALEGFVRAGGGVVAVHRALICRVKDGKLARISAFMNGKELAESLGQWPPPAAK